MTLYKVLEVLHKATRPAHQALNGLSLLQVSSLAAPFLLRPKPGVMISTTSMMQSRVVLDESKHFLSLPTERCQLMIMLMVDLQPTLFASMRSSLLAKQKALNRSVQGLKKALAALAEPVGTVQFFPRDQEAPGPPAAEVVSMDVEYTSQSVARIEMSTTSVKRMGALYEALEELYVLRRDNSPDRPPAGSTAIFAVYEEEDSETEEEQLGVDSPSSPSVNSAYIDEQRKHESPLSSPATTAPAFPYPLPSGRIFPSLRDLLGDKRWRITAVVVPEKHTAATAEDENIFSFMEFMASSDRQCSPYSSLAIHCLTVFLRMYV